MKKSTYFASRPSEGWPDPKDLERYFLGPPGERWFFETGNDTAGLDAVGVDGTERLGPGEGRISVRLAMWGNRDLGVLLIYSKLGGGHHQTYSSKGDLSRLRQWVRGMHGTLLPVGLFVPFPTAWKVVKSSSKQMGSCQTA